MSAWKPDRIAKILAAWITYLLVFSWLPLVRVVMDGDSYRWGTSHFGRSFSAAGIGPDVWLLVVKSALLLILLFGTLRGGGALFRWLLVGWSVAMAADVVHGVITDPGGFEFHGDTLGIHLNLGVTVVAVVGFFSALALWWAMARWRRPAAAVAWGARNKLLLGILVALLPLQFVLLRFGAPHGTTDAVGVLITIAQCPLAYFALYPWASRG